MLISGADDSMIIGWDIFKKTIVFKAYEPSLSLTSFASHPSRPFTLVTSHFDASIQQWSLLGLPDVALTRLKFILGMPLDQIIDSQDDLGTGSDIKSRLSGLNSLELG